MIDLELTTSGPLFDARRATRIGEDLAKDIREDLGQQGLAGVKAVLASPWPAGIRQRTPYLETKLQIERRRGAVRVHNGDVIHRHWIEGTGSRNRPRPGFPGYHAFGKTYGTLQREIPRTTDRHVRYAIDRWNGV